jgi:hypothetical protein
MSFLFFFSANIFFNPFYSIRTTPIRIDIYSAEL